ncbi:MAG: ParB/RepB/Spo0J family partition protein [Candidatus Eisenbacteria bacterium]
MSKAFELVEIEVGNLKPNPWNPNRMSDEMYHKLKAYIKREGLVEPIVVRPKGEGYEILGGFHRWKIARDLGYETVPCAVVELDDRRATILSINLNEMKGQSVSALLSELVHDLSQELSLEDLETQLPYSEADLKDVLEVMKIPDGLEAYLDAEIEKAERERPHILSFVVEDVDTVEKALESASQRNGGLTRGESLVEIARAYVGEVTAK